MYLMSYVLHAAGGRGGGEEGGGGGGGGGGINEYVLHAAGRSISEQLAHCSIS